jgi:hypothetical protein
MLVEAIHAWSRFLLAADFTPSTALAWCLLLGIVLLAYSFDTVYRILERTYSSANIACILQLAGVLGLTSDLWTNIFQHIDTNYPALSFLIAAFALFLSTARQGRNRLHGDDGVRLGVLINAYVHYHLRTVPQHCL